MIDNKADLLANDCISLVASYLSKNHQNLSILHLYPQNILIEILDNLPLYLKKHQSPEIETALRYDIEKTLLTKSLESELLSKNYIGKIKKYKFLTCSFLIFFLC